MSGLKDAIVLYAELQNAYDAGLWSSHNPGEVILSRLTCSWYRPYVAVSVPIVSVILVILVTARPFLITGAGRASGRGLRRRGETVMASSNSSRCWSASASVTE
jgi:hypothetical protein